MEKREKLTQINDQITLINDANESTCYLVTGTERALLIDTANGFVDLNALCKQLTDLPVTVVNTHGHCDHIFGNVYFDEAHLHPDDFALHDEHFRFPEAVAFMSEHRLHPAKLIPLTEGEVFDLGGGLTLEVVLLSGHTKGSIGLLDRKHRILFSGDGVIPQIWNQLDESQPLSTLVATLEKLKREHGGEFDVLLHGHARGTVSADYYVEGLLRAATEILSGNRAGEEAYHYDFGDALAHRYGPDENDRLIFTEEKVK